MYHSAPIDASPKWFCKPFVVHCFWVDVGIGEKHMKHISQALFGTSNFSGAGGATRTFAPIPVSRGNAIEPTDKGTFILPLKQSFMKNRRIMDSTARLIALISGWAGQGGPIETTQGIIAKHLGKSVRQVQRMLDDAWREGYLTFAYTKSRIGMITGIKIFLRLERIRKAPDKPMERRKPGTTFMSDTNGKQINYTKDEALELQLRRLSNAIGVNYQLA